MTEISKPSNVLKGRVVTLEQIRADNALIDSSKAYNYGISYKYEPNTLPRQVDVARFNKCERDNEKEVAILQNAVKCLYTMSFGPEDTSIFDEYADDTLLTFDYATGKTLFDEETFKKDLSEHKNKQRTLIAEYNKIVASSTLANAIENAKKLQQIKDKLAELQATQPKKDDEKYNHPEIVKGNISVKQVLDRYKELCELRDKCAQEWEQYEIDYKRSHSKKLSISEDTFKIVKDLYKDGIYFSSGAAEKLNAAVARYESVKDFNENNWKEVNFTAREESGKFLTQKQFKLWQKYRGYVHEYNGPAVTDWMMYEQFNDTDLMWLKALNSFNERVTALKRIEEQNSSK